MPTAGERRALIRPITDSDIGPLMRQVGPLVDSLYPQGAAKLLRRLEDARDGYASAHVVVPSPEALSNQTLPTAAPLALVAEAAKGLCRVKISTFWVAPRARRLGLGSMLVDHRMQAWRRTGVERAAITVCRDRALEIEALFVPRGFDQRLVVPALYGAERDEIVLVWRGCQMKPQTSGPQRSRLRGLGVQSARRHSSGARTRAHLLPAAV